MIKGFRQIASLTVISRVFGMVRDMAFAYFLGAGALMDIWVFAFMIPNLARRLFGEGAASASFIPVYSEQLQKDPENAKKLASTVVSVIFLTLSVLVCIGELTIWIWYKFVSTLPTTELRLKLTAMMLPYMTIVCTVAILAGILNSHKHFAMPAAAPVVLNIFIISSMCFSGWVLKIVPSKMVFVAAAAVLAAGFVQIFMQIIPLRRHHVTIRPVWEVKSEPFKRVILLMLPMIFGMTVTQINTLADVLIASGFSGSAEKGEFFTMLGHQVRYPLWAGSLSQLFFSQRLYQFPLGVLGISLATAIFPVMSSDAAKKDYKALSQTISRGLSAAAFVALPATAGLLLVRRPLVAVIFERGQFTNTDTALTAGVLCFYALGLCGFFSQQIVTRAFYSMQDSKTPVKSALAAVFANVMLNLTLIWVMGTAGLALSTAICSYLQVTVLLLLLKKRFGNVITQGYWQTISKTIVATAVMFAVGHVTTMLLANLPLTVWFEVLRLAILVPAAAATYFFAAKFLKIKSLSLITGRR